MIWLPFHWYWCRTVGNRIYYYPTLSAENFRCSWRSNYATLGISIDMPVYLCILTMTYLKDSISHLLVWVHATRPRGPRDHQSGLRSCFIKAGQAGRGEFICYLLSDMVTNSRTLLDLNENRHTWCHDGGPAKCRFLGNLNKAWISDLLERQTGQLVAVGIVVVNSTTARCVDLEKCRLDMSFIVMISLSYLKTMLLPSIS